MKMEKVFKIQGFIASIWTLANIFKCFISNQVNDDFVKIMVQGISAIQKLNPANNQIGPIGAQEFAKEE